MMQVDKFTALGRNAIGAAQSAALAANHQKLMAEHILAAFAGLGIHNALVELSEAEVPIFDGSSRIFVKAMLESGVIEHDKKTA